MLLNFSKYQGTSVQLSIEQIKFLCDRKFGIGADGLMLLQTAQGYDFEMQYYNADGNEGSMCGNGGRCLVQFASDNGIKKTEYLFIAIDGEHQAKFGSKKWVELKMKDVHEVQIRKHGDFVLNTGSPHFVTPVQDVLSTNVVKSGKEIRYNKEFEAVGINVNFVQPIDEDSIMVRTYERGVEDETLSCGTGVTACALVFAHNEKGFNRKNVKTLGGYLAVEFDKINDHTFNNIWLCGPATFVFNGSIEL
ncbi:MAG: diaminopimelate epimerase [Chitinophagaceae bacterium]|nr:diaminopimelate epimerase [Chitinophagaceae bacterium]